MNAQLGRWISADPLAVHSPGEADLNLYAYVSGGVLSNIDPIGLDEGWLGIDWGKATMNAAWNVANMTGGAQAYWDAGEAVGRGNYGDALLKAGEGTARNVFATVVIPVRAAQGTGEMIGATAVATGVVDTNEEAQKQARQDLAEGAITAVFTAGLMRGATKGKSGGGGSKTSAKPSAGVKKGTTTAPKVNKAPTVEYLGGQADAPVARAAPKPAGKGPKLFRGVPKAVKGSKRGQRMYKDAQQGIARPTGTKTDHATLKEHIDGVDVESGATTWTTNPKVARRFAGPDGIVLEVERSAVSSQELSVPRTTTAPSTQAGESQVLLGGEVKARVSSEH